MMIEGFDNRHSTSMFNPASSAKWGWNRWLTQCQMDLTTWGVIQVLPTTPAVALVIGFSSELVWLASRLVDDSVDV